MRRSSVLLGAALVVGGLLATPVTSAGVEPSSPAANAATRATPTGQQTSTGPKTRLAKKPNIVFVLMDDFSLELLSTMPEAQRLKAQGATYENSFVIDSLCCPSRSALLTGQTPHQTGVRTNTVGDPDDPIGGYQAFVANGNEKKQFSVQLQQSGYTTGFVGKFLNGYETSPAADGTPVAPPKVEGWTEWNAILGGGYNGWGYRSLFLDDAGEVQMTFHGKPALSTSVATRDKQYATNVASDLAADFITRHQSDDEPYFLEVATYGPHSQLQVAYPNIYSNFPPAFADQAPAGQTDGGNCGLKSCSDLTLADLTGYGDPRDDNAPTYLNSDGTTSPAPAWRTNEITLTDGQALRRYRDRARMVQSIDRMITRLRTLAGPDTYFVLTADNGFHLGQHQLNGGKGTPYDSDTRVPLVVAGPGITPGVRSQYVSNIDLAPTFEEIGGADVPSWSAGHSLVSSLVDADAPGSHYAFFEHTGGILPGDPDTDDGDIGIIPSYVAVRSPKGLLARFDLDPTWDGHDYAYELYTYDTAAFEDRNVFAEHAHEPWVQDLVRRLERYDGCEPQECRALTHPAAASANGPGGA